MKARASRLVNTAFDENGYNNPRGHSKARSLLLNDHNKKVPESRNNIDLHETDSCHGGAADKNNILIDRRFEIFGFQRGFRINLPKDF